MLDIGTKIRVELPDSEVWQFPVPHACLSERTIRLTYWPLKLQELVAAEVLQCSAQGKRCKLLIDGKVGFVHED